MYFSQNVIEYKQITSQLWELCQIVKLAWNMFAWTGDWFLVEQLGGWERLVLMKIAWNIHLSGRVLVSDQDSWDHKLHALMAKATRVS